MLDSVGRIGMVGRGRPGGLRLGPELMLNGGFATDTVWNKGAGWTIAGGVAVRVPNASPTVLSQGSLTLVAGASYLLVYTITIRTAGTVTGRLSGGTTVSGAANNAANTYHEVLTAVTGNNTLQFNASSGGDLSMDNVSLKLILWAP